MFTKPNNFNLYQAQNENTNFKKKTNSTVGIT